VNNKLERKCKETAVFKSRYCPEISLKELRRTKVLAMAAGFPT
jgi:hypothetical protein